ncbi:MAG TPA: dicarboxylate/amino acid:cation symporter [Nannocystis sp.]
MSTTLLGAALRRYRRLGLGVRILLWMLLGVAAGLFFGPATAIIAPIGALFIRLLMLAAVPLVLCNVVAGVAGLPDLRVLGRYGARTLVYYVGTSALALLVGVLVALWLQPGVGMRLTAPVAADFGQVPDLGDVLFGLVPENIFAALAAGDVAQVVVFALLLGVAALSLPPDLKAPLRTGFDLAAQLLRRLVALIMRAGPLGVFALTATTVGEHGPGVFGPLSRFVATVWLAQALMVLLYMVLLRTFARRRPWPWLCQAGPVFATTAATCSSLASLAVALDVAETRLGLPHRVYSFTLPLGAQLNKDGTAIMLAGILLFTAQAAGAQFSAGEILAIILVGLLLSEGSTGIPGGGMVIAFMFVDAFHLPLEIAAIVAGVYRLVDMGSTTVNVMGDLVWTTILSRWDRADDPAPT